MSAVDPRVLKQFERSNKVLVPLDRTTKQPPMCFCRNPACRTADHPEWFIFNSDHAEVSCPKCGATESPMIGLFALVHFMAVLPTGNIAGSGGIRYTVACDPSRHYLATATNNEAATDQVSAVNCPGCLEAIATKAVAVTPGQPIVAN